MKKTTLIILIVTSLVVLGLLGYFLFFGEEEQETQNEGVGGVFPEGGDQGVDQRGSGVEEFFELGGGATDETQENEKGVVLQKLTNRPVAGFSLFRDDSGTTTLESSLKIRFVEMGTGHIYEASSGDVFERISNTTIAKTSNAVWSDGGSLVLIQFEEDNSGNLKSFLADVVDKRSETESLQGLFLEDNLISPSFEPGGSSLVYLKKTSEGSEVRVLNTENNGVDVVFQSPLTEWVLDWVSAESVVMNTSPSGTTEGFSYEKSFGVSDPQKVVGGLLGLTTKVSKFGDVFFSASSGNTLHLFEEQAGERVGRSPDTLPEKCDYLEGVFICGVPNNIPDAVYPDTWYRGEVSFNDSIWAIYTGGVFSELLYQGDEVFDVVKPQISDDGSVFLFVNKKDNNLWALVGGEGGLFE